MLYSIVVQTLALCTLIALASFAALAVMLASAGGRRSLLGFLGGQERHPIAWAWSVAVLATAGSLFFSEVAGMVPCLLCWYQRIAMYPLVAILAVAWVRGDPGVWRYALPLPVIGVIISTYHRILQERPALELFPCGVGPPCSGRYVNALGFITIPTMAGSAFLLSITLLLTLRLLERGARA